MRDACRGAGHAQSRPSRLHSPCKLTDDSKDMHGSLYAIGLVVATCLTQVLAAATPNIIFILADDMVRSALSRH